MQGALIKWILTFAGTGTNLPQIAFMLPQSIGSRSPLPLVLPSVKRLSALEGIQLNSRAMCYSL